MREAGPGRAAGGQEPRLKSWSGHSDTRSDPVKKRSGRPKSGGTPAGGEILTVRWRCPRFGKIVLHGPRLPPAVPEALLSLDELQSFQPFNLYTSILVGRYSVQWDMDGLFVVERRGSGTAQPQYAQYMRAHSPYRRRSTAAAPLHKRPTQVGSPNIHTHTHTHRWETHPSLATPPTRRGRRGLRPAPEQPPTLPLRA